MVERLLRAIPFLISAFIASSIFWAPWHSWTATLLAGSLTVFFVYWVIRSYSVTIAAWIAIRRLDQWVKVDWAARYRAEERDTPWDWPRHMVIIPNYKEPEQGLERTLTALAAQKHPEQLVIVLAMEDREADVHEKARRLTSKFAGTFGDLFATFHPAGIPGEAPGKGSNEAWAARQAYLRLIETAGDDLDRYSVTSCDADAIFHPNHFTATNYQFLTAEDRYRTFWQPAIFNTNNIWEVPAPLRIPEGLSGVNRASNLILPFSVKFPTSCYTLSWRMLHEVDYWDEEVIPEDWHIYMKCTFSLGNRVRVKPIWIPLGNDCVLSETSAKTFRAHYTQAKRHAWGASDIPYAWRAVANGGPASFFRRLTLASALTKVHTFWVAQWYLVTLGVLLPAKMTGSFGASMPEWWSHKAFNIPGIGLHPENIVNPEAWLTIGRAGVIEPTIWLNLCGLLLTLCLPPLVGIVAFEAKIRPARPAGVSRIETFKQLGMWPLMAPITFFWASLPALDAQLHLARGRDLIYRVAEKGSRAFRPADEPSTLDRVAPEGHHPHSHLMTDIAEEILAMPSILTLSPVHEPAWNVVANDDRYVLKDTLLGGMTVSETVLHAGQSTRGHAHPWPEIYICNTGRGTLFLDHDGGRPMTPGTRVIVPSNVHHRVATEDGVTFTSIFEGPRR